MVKRNQSSLGIDLSDKTLNFCAMNATAGVVAEGKVPLTPASIAELWVKHGNVDVIVIEAGTPSNWVRELLARLGARAIVADPRKLKAVTDSVRKSDVRDARMLARLGLADEELLSPTYDRPAEYRRALTLLKIRDQQARARSATVLEIRSQVKLEGSRTPKCDAAQFHQHEDAVPDVLKAALAPLFKTLRAVAEAIGDLDTQIKAAGASFPIVAQLEAVAGIGPITALAFVAVVGDPKRFTHTRDIGAYLGLVPKRDQSGVADPSRRISKAGCGMLRSLLTQCAHTLCRANGKDCALRRKALQMLEERGQVAKRKVIVAIARKLAVLMLSLWKSGQAWKPLHRVAASAVDAPQPVVLDECGLCPAPSEGVTESAPSSTTRTHACTGGESPTKSADGSTGRTGASTPGARTKPPSRMARASAPATPATPSAPAAPACAGDPASIASASGAKPRSRRGRFAAEGVPPTA